MWVEGWGQLPGQLVVVSGPSGSGKSSVVRRLLDSKSLNVQLSVSATTRDPRPGERQGVDYNFVNAEAFVDLKNHDKLLEWAEYNGQFYGTPKQTVFDALGTGKSVLLEIEVQGALQVRRQAPTALFVFIRTPTFRTLETRLRDRGTESDEVIHRRLQKARAELAEAHWYDHQLINDDFDECVEQFITLLKTYGCGG